MKIYEEKDGDAIIFDIVDEQDDEVSAARRVKLYNVANSITGENKDEDGNILPRDCGTHHKMSVMAIASHSELLGNGDDYEKTIQEILYVRDHGEPDCNPITGENAWTSAYDELIKRVNSEADISVMSASANEIDGIEKTRSLLGLPSNSGISAMSVSSDDVDGIESYSVQQNVIDVINSYASDIEASREKFLSMLKVEKTNDMK